LKYLTARRERSLGNRQLNGREKESQAVDSDLLVVRASMFLDLTGYILLALVTSQNQFIGSTVILSFAGGFHPAAQSLALALTYPSAHAAKVSADASSVPSSGKQETGRLFGALAVIQALCSQVVGPALFSATFVASIESHPRAIFWVSSAIITFALGALLFVQLDSRNEPEEGERAPLLV
jgi:MFS family permease